MSFIKRILVPTTPLVLVVLLFLAMSTIGKGKPHPTPDLLKAVVILNDAQIKSLPTAFFQIVPAPGPGKVIVASHGFSRFSAAYTNISANAGINVEFSFAFPFYLADETASESGNTVTAMIGQSQNRISFLAAPYLANHNGYTLGSVGWADFDVANVPLKLTAYNAGGNFTGGHPSNTLKVAVYYTIEDL